LPNFYQFLVFFTKNAGNQCCNEHKIVTVLRLHFTESPNILLLTLHAVFIYIGSLKCFRFLTFVCQTLSDI